MSNGVANSLAGAGTIAQILLTYPLQIVNTGQRTERRAKKEAGDAELESSSRRGTLFEMLQVIKIEGWGGLYSGLKPSLVGTAASQGDILFLLPRFQEQSRRDCSGAEEERTRRWDRWHALLAYCSCDCRSRLQAKQEIGKNSASRYTGTMDAIVKIISYEGLPGFYEGMGTKIVQSVFTASVLFMVKEELVKAHLILADGSSRILKPRSGIKLMGERILSATPRAIESTVSV